MANNLGGAHYDKGKQKPKEKALAALNQQWELAERPACIFGMLSCGQDLAASASTQELLNAIKKY